MKKCKKALNKASFSNKVINFIKISSENLEFFEEKVYKEVDSLYLLGV